jgi:hypothetical protein
MIERRKKERFMKNQNLTIAFSVDQPPQEVFDAINDVRGWWSEEIEGSTDKLGAKFKFHYKDLHRSTQKITAFVPGKKVATGKGQPAQKEKGAGSAVSR